MSFIFGILLIDKYKILGILLDTGSVSQKLARTWVSEIKINSQNNSESANFETAYAYHHFSNTGKSGSFDFVII